MKKFSIAYLLAFSLFGCASVKSIDPDVQNQYVSMLRKMDLFPVYPPGENLQVGDVFLTVASDQSAAAPEGDPNTRPTSIWVGSLKTIRQEARKHAQDRFLPFPSSSDTPIAADAPIPMDSLPIISFPAVTMSAANAAEFAGVTPGGAAALGVRSGEQISLNFEKARTYGLPIGAAQTGAPHDSGHLSPEIIKDLQETICPHWSRAHRVLADMLKREGARGQNPPCGLDSGNSCSMQIVTRTYLTTRIIYSHARASSNSFGLNLPFLNGGPGPLATPEAPSVNLNLNVTADSAGAAELAKFLQGIEPSQSASSRAGFGASQGRASIASFSQSYDRPIAFAYASIALGPSELQNLRSACSLPQTGDPQ